MTDDHRHTFMTQGNEGGVDLNRSAEAKSTTGTGGSSVAFTGASVSQSTRLHEKMREMKEMDDALSLMKSDYARRIRAVKEGEAKFLIKQHNIVKYLKRFKLFILESDSKRARAEKKEADESKQRSQKIREIEALKAHLLALQSTRSELKAKMEAYRANKTYLESVKDAVPEQYGEIDELLVRYSILKQTNTDLSESNRQVQSKMETMTQHLQALNKQKQNELLVQNSKFAHLLQRLEQVTNETSAIENEVGQAEERSTESQRYFCEISMAIKNIYARTMSSLPSKKAAAQMRKRLQVSKEMQEAQQMAAAKAKAAALVASMSNTSAREKGSESDSDDARDADRPSSSKTKNQQSSSSASSSSTSAATSTTTTPPSAQHTHLIQLLDAISERLQDLQFIVEQVYPGPPSGVHILREGGSLSGSTYAYGAGGGGGGAHGHGSHPGSASASAYSERSRRAIQMASIRAAAGSTNQSANNSTSAHQSSSHVSLNSSVSRSRLGGGHSHAQSNSRARLAPGHHAQLDSPSTGSNTPTAPAPDPDLTPRRAKVLAEERRKQDMERKFQHINTSLQQKHAGYLLATKLPPVKSGQQDY